MAFLTGMELYAGVCEKHRFPGALEGASVVSKTVFDQYIDLFSAVAAIGYGDPQPAAQQQWIYYFYLYSPDVDEFSASYHCLAVSSGKDWNY